MIEGKGSMMNITSLTQNLIVRKCSRRDVGFNIQHYMSML